jgi:glutathione S-transferase
MIQHYKLYHFPLTRSARALWALYETVGDDSDIEIEVVPLFDGGQYEKKYLAKNPNHHVPLLEVTLSDGSTRRMLESAAMVEWLVDASPEYGLAPAPGPSWERADYLSILHFGATWMDMMLWQIRIHQDVLPEEEQDERTVKRYRDKFTQEVEPQLLERLSGSDYVCGNTFSGADIVVGHNVRWARAYRLCSDDVFRAYLSRVSKRPAFIKAFADAADFGAG